MFNKKYEERLGIWSSFRESLEKAEDPFRLLIDFYKDAPQVSIHTDPYNREIWPTPWELLEENQYCDFCRVLAYCYSLQLTDRFKESVFEIHIITTGLEIYYLLQVDNWILGYEENEVIDKSQLPSDFKPQVTYTMALGQ